MRLLAVLALTAAGCSSTGAVLDPPSPAVVSSRPVDRFAWPQRGQASIVLDGRVRDSAGQRPASIASVAKVMTAYVVVQHLAPDARLVVDADDATDTARRGRRGESVVPVVTGEVLTRDDALTALLLPSANNVAAMLADRVAGRTAFLGLMNATARQLGMQHTSYTDPSGYAPSTVSTAHDQLLLWRAVMDVPVLARLLGLSTAVLPVVGPVVNTNGLLGQDGFIAGKTGSTSAAGGCLAFRVVRGGRVLDGVVLGQQGGRLVDAGLAAATDVARQALGTSG